MNSHSCIVFVICRISYGILIFYCHELDDMGPLAVFIVMKRIPKSDYNYCNLKKKQLKNAYNKYVQRVKK